jgi:hypothetical protein
MHKLIKCTLVASAFGLAIVGSARTASVAQTSQASPMVLYRSIKVDGLSIFYREVGRPDAPTLLLLHGFPSSSRMYEPLLTRLSARYHLVAPDYPGFGHSDAPSVKEFSYTFDHISQVALYRGARPKSLCALHAGLWRTRRVPARHHPP